MPTSTSSFGSWYDEQKAAESGESTSSWSSIDIEQALPLFNSENLPGFSIDSMRQSMEAQMPKKILGMGYQQRFKVSKNKQSQYVERDWDYSKRILVA